jgi:nucleoside-diphosphate-sugar epimerase
MKILLVGAHSSLAMVLRPVLASFAEIVTAGRRGCDVELDLAWNADRFEIPVGVDVVINLAAHFGGNGFSDLLAAEEINALGPLKLANACTRFGASQLVHVSSIFAGMEENSPFYNEYALSKCHAEELLRLYSRRAGLRVAILRPSQIYGTGERFRRHQPFLYSLLDQAQSGWPIVLNGCNDAIRNFIHAEDVAEIIACVVRQQIEGLYVCASLSNVRFSEIAKAAAQAFGGTSSIRFDTDKPDIPDNVFESEIKLYQMIDYTPRITLQEGLEREASRRTARS